MNKSESLEEDIQRALFGIILERGNQSLSQASLNIGIFNMEDLCFAVNALLAKELIRPHKGTANYSPERIVYEANI